MCIRDRVCLFGLHTPGNVHWKAALEVHTTRRCSLSQAQAHIRLGDGTCRSDVVLMAPPRVDLLVSVLASLQLEPRITSDREILVPPSNPISSLCPVGFQLVWSCGLPQAARRTAWLYFCSVAPARATRFWHSPDKQMSAQCVTQTVGGPAAWASAVV